MGRQYNKRGLELNWLKGKYWWLQSHAPVSWRRLMKTWYERLPTFGRKYFYGERAEDAFLQTYFNALQSLYSPVEKSLPVYLRKSVGKGFFVDVGANSPIFNSNTYWFYRQGWRGINIDAAPGSMEIFNKVRFDDVNVEALVSDRETEITFYHWGTPFPANTVSPEYAQIMTNQYGREPTRIVMKTRRLDSLLDEFLPFNQKIDFLNVDAEGHDLEVLRSNDWERYRPDLILVEDFSFSLADVDKSQLLQFMNGVRYEMYAWLRPTVVFRREGLQDWQDIVANDVHGH